MSEVARLERKIDKITRLLESKQKPMWVKASVITGLTGWTKDQMNVARENRYVDFKVDEKEGKKEFWYDLNSLNEKFIKQRA